MSYQYTSDPQWINAPDNLKTRYSIYHHNATELGWDVKTFTEWMMS